MAARTLKVVRAIDGADDVLFATSLNEGEAATVAVATRPDLDPDLNPGITAEDITQLEDYVVTIAVPEPEAKPKAKTAAKAKP